MPLEPNVGCFRSRPRRESEESSNSTSSQLQGCQWEGAGRRMDTPLPLQRSHPLRHQRPRPTMPRPGLCPPAHPWEAAELAPLVHHTSGQGGEGAVRAVGTLAPALTTPEPGPGPARRGLTLPQGQAGAPGTGLGAADPARHPRGRRAPQAHLQRVKSAYSPPPDRRLRSAGLPRPAQPLSSAPLCSLSSTARTPPPGSSPTRQELPGGPRPFCDARGRGSEHAQERARCGAGLWE